jgi:NAD(P)-dependent dehydrogenase (short-subunit alcohol dehydrogenase family)
MKNISDRVAAITGAGSGIGRALAFALAKRGCRLALADIGADALDETERALHAYGASLGLARSPVIACTKVDMAAREQVEVWATSTFERFGAVHLIFNNAGVAQAGTVEANSYADYEWVMGVNFWGVVYGTKAFLPLLKRSGEGHIVNVSSVFGLCSQPTQSAYNASKFAVRGFTESLRLELDMQGGTVSATCVHPGGVKTNIARSSRVNASVGTLFGKGETELTADFEKNFRTTPEDAAETILRGVERNARRVLVGADAWGIDAMQRLLPSGYQRIVGTIADRQRGRAQSRKGG